MRGFSQAAEVSGSAGNEGEGGGGVCWRGCLFPKNGDCAGFQIGPSARGLRCSSYIAGFSTPDGVNFKFEQECGESVGRDQVEERSMSRVGVLFKDGGCAGGRIGPSAQDLR